MKKVIRSFIYLAILFMFLTVGMQVAPSTAEAATTSLNKKEVTIYVGKSQQLTLNNASGITWRSSKTSVASVTTDGTVTGKKAGSTVITASTAGKNYTCTVTVKNRAVTGITASQAQYSLEAGDDFSLKATISPSNATIKSVTWNSSNTYTATVDTKGVVTAIAEGTATITATTKDGNLQASCTITVTPKIPANATNMEITTGDGGEFISGINTLEYSFELDKAAEDVTVDILDALDNSIMKLSAGDLKPTFATSVDWDGKNESGNAVNGTFRMKVTADDTETFSEYFTLYSISPFGKGNGSKDDPYMVSSIDELTQMQQHNGYYFKQDADIDFAYASFNSLFAADAAFSGTFDGNGFTISNLLGNAPIFHTIGKDGKLNNLKLVNCSVSASASIALLTQNNYGTISNCDVQGTVTVNSSYCYAGLYALDNFGIISDCKGSGVVQASSNENSHAGGIVCYNNEGAKIIQCSSYVDVTAISTSGDYYSDAGGVAYFNKSGAYIVNTTAYGLIETKTIRTYAYFKHPGGIAAGNDGQIVKSSYLGGSQINLANWGSGLIQ